MPLAECNTTLIEHNRKASQSALRYGIHKGQYCAYDLSSVGANSCAGDSGGPLHVFRSDKAIATVIGIISWGFNCGLTSFPSVYTRVAYYKDWIETQVWKN